MLMLDMIWRVLNIGKIGSEVFIPVTMKNTVFWDVAPCRSCVNQRFGGTYRLHLQGKKNPRVRNQRKQVAVCSSWFLTRGFFLPWRWRRYVPPKRWFTQDLHGATSQKTVSFIGKIHFRIQLKYVTSIKYEYNRPITVKVIIRVYRPHTELS
jgi:hypothetical protein